MQLWAHTRRLLIYRNHFDALEFWNYMNSSRLVGWCLDFIYAQNLKVPFSNNNIRFIALIGSLNSFSAKRTIKKKKIITEMTEKINHDK